MCASKTSTRMRRIHAPAQGLLAHAISDMSAFQKASWRHIVFYAQCFAAVLAGNKVKDMEKHTLDDWSIRIKDAF